MKNLKFIFLLFLMVGCSHYNWVVRNEQKVCEFCNRNVKSDSSIVIKEDTFRLVISVPIIDSAYIELYLKCDSLNNVLVQRKSFYDSRYQDINFKYNSGLLVVKSKIDSLKIVKEQLRIEKEKIKVINKVEEKKVIIKRIPIYVFFLLGLLFLLCIKSLIR